MRTKKQLADKSGQETFNLQRQCADQARQLFKQLGFDENAKPPNYQEYHSHYNNSLKKCFVAIETSAMTGKPIEQVLQKFLFDAIERRPYAEYSWISKEGKKFWEVPPLQCELHPSIGADNRCS